MFSCQLCQALCQAFSCFLNLTEKGKTEENLEAVEGKHLGIAKWVKPQDKVWVSGEERLPVVPGESYSAPRWELCFGGCCEECEKLNLLLRRGCPSCRLPGVQMVARVGFCA